VLDENEDNRYFGEWFKQLMQRISNKGGLQVHDTYFVLWSRLHKNQTDLTIEKNDFIRLGTFTSTQVDFHPSRIRGLMIT